MKICIFTRWLPFVKSHVKECTFYILAYELLAEEKKQLQKTQLLFYKRKKI